MGLGSAGREEEVQDDWPDGLALAGWAVKERVWSEWTVTGLAGSLALALAATGTFGVPSCRSGSGCLSLAGKGRAVDDRGEGVGGDSGRRRFR